MECITVTLVIVLNTKGFVILLRKKYYVLQSLAVVTLGDKQMAQRIDSLDGDDESKRFYLQVHKILCLLYFFCFIGSGPGPTRSRCKDSDPSSPWKNDPAPDLLDLADSCILYQFICTIQLTPFLILDENLYCQSVMVLSRNVHTSEKVFKHQR